MAKPACCSECASGGTCPGGPEDGPEKEHPANEIRRGEPVQRQSSQAQTQGAPPTAAPENEPRLDRIREILKNWWVGPVDESEIEGLWSEFGPRLPEMAARHFPLFLQCLDRGAELDDLDELDSVRDMFRRDVQGLARQYLDRNEEHVLTELRRLGLEEGGTHAVDPEEQRDRLADIQEDARVVARGQEAQRALRTIPVGYSYVTYPSVAGQTRTERVVDTFDPAAPPMIAAREEGMAPWVEVKEQYDRVTALISGVANRNPSIYAALREGQIGAVAGADPQAARGAVEGVLRRVLDNIRSTRPKIGTGDLDYRDLRPIHEQLFGGRAAAPSGTSWQDPFHRWVARDVLSDHESREFWITLGLGTLAAAAFVVAEIATAGSATFFLAAGVGLLATGAGAARSWEQYLDLAEAAHTNVSGEHALVSEGQASAALLSAILDTVFAFADAYGLRRAATRAGAAAAGAMATRETAEAMEREVADMAAREAAEQAERRTAGTLMRGAEELAQGVVHEVQVVIGESAHTLKLIRSGERLALWLCTDCRRLIAQLDTVVASIPADGPHAALRQELEQIRDQALEFERRFGLPAGTPERIQQNRLNAETNRLANRLAQLSQRHPDVEGLVFFRTFVGGAEAAENILGQALVTRLRAELGEEGLAQLMRDLRPVSLRNLSDLPGTEIRDLVARHGADPVAWIGEELTGAETRRLLGELAAASLPHLSTGRRRISGSQLRKLIDDIGAPAIDRLAEPLGGRKLVELADLGMFTIDRAKQQLVDQGAGAAVRNLPPVRGRTVADIERDLVAAGMTGPNLVRNQRIWTHPDGSVVRIKVDPLATKGWPEHLVREISRTPGAFGNKDIFVKVTENGRLIPAGTTFPETRLREWFRTSSVPPRLPNPDELLAMMGIWGRAGHVTIQP